MTANVVGLAFLAALVMLAPLAAAEADSGNTTTSDRPDDAAWVEDCPPDMMCAYSDTPHEGDDKNITRDPDCEYCRFGPDDCIDCTGMPVPADDNTTWGTDCPPGVYCMYDGAPDDADGDLETTGVESEESSALGVVAVAAVGILGLAFLTRRRDA